MSDHLNESKRIFENIDKEFDRLEEIGLFDRTKALFQKSKKETNDYLNKVQNSSFWKGLKSSLQMKFIEVFKGDSESLKKGLEVWGDNLSYEAKEYVKNIIHLKEKEEEAKEKALKAKGEESGEGKKKSASSSKPYYDQENSLYYFSKEGKAKKIKLKSGSDQAAHRFFESYDWVNGKLSWLTKGNFNAELISVDAKKEEVAYFVGIWEGGDFQNGIMLNGSKFLGGRFVGGYFNEDYKNWEATPKHFFGNTARTNMGGILGLPDVDENNIPDSFNIIQLKPGYSVKISTNEYKTKHVIQMEKRLDNQNSSFIFNHLNQGNAKLIEWEPIRKNLARANVALGKQFHIPGFITLKGKINKIEVVRSTSTSKEKEIQSLGKKGGSPLKKLPLSKKTPLFGDMGLRGDFYFYSKNPEDVYVFNYLVDDIKQGSPYMKKILDSIKESGSGYGGVEGLEGILSKGEIKTEERYVKFLSDVINKVAGNLVSRNPDTKKYQKNPSYEGLWKTAIKRYLGVKEEKAKENPRKKTKNSATSRYSSGNRKTNKKGVNRGRYPSASGK